MNKVNLVVDKAIALSYTRNDFQLTFYAKVLDKMSRNIINNKFSNNSVEYLIVRYNSKTNKFKIIPHLRSEFIGSNKRISPGLINELTAVNESEKFSDYVDFIKQQVDNNYKNDTHKFDIDRKVRFYVNL